MAMMKPDQKTVALVYIRQSVTDPKDENNYSPRTQRAAALARPEITGMRHEVYEDLDLSGGSVVGRDAYQKMSDRLDDGDVGFLVCYDLGRLARDLGDQQALFKVAERYGVKVIDALKNIVFDPGKASDKFIANVFGSMNEFQRDEIGEKISGALATKAKGGDLVGPVPCGYIRRHTTNEASGKVIKTWVEILQSAAEVIRIIFRDYATGAFSFKSLARSLNTRGIQPPQRHNVGRGNRPVGSPKHAAIFTADSIKDMLRNPRYAGRVPLRDGSTVQGTFPAIIDVETFEKCERIRVSQRFKGKTQPGAANIGSAYLLSGVLRCAACGSTMSGHTRTPDRIHRQTRRTYTCYRRRVAGGCAAPTIPQEVVEADLLAVLRTMALPPGFALAVDKAVAARMRTFGAAKTVSENTLKERQRRINEVYEAGRMTPDEWKAKSAEIDEQRSQLIVPPAALFAQQQQVLTTLVVEWDGMTTDEK